MSGAGYGFYISDIGEKNLRRKPLMNLMKYYAPEYWKTYDGSSDFFEFLRGYENGSGSAGLPALMAEALNQRIDTDCFVTGGAAGGEAVYLRYSAPWNCRNIKDLSEKECRRKMVNLICEISTLSTDDADRLIAEIRADNQP